MQAPETVEQEIQRKGLIAARVTPERIESRIIRESFHVDGTLTICVLELVNGTKVTGESACVSPANFNAEIGQRIARQNAVNKIWPLEGYLLAERVHARSNPVPRPPTEVEFIARVCHYVNRAYCQALGDNSQPAWSDAPDWQRASAMNGVVLHLSNPDAGPQASHEAWMKEKLETGWQYGPLKDPERKEHPCIVPFDALPREQQAKDFIFRAVVHALSS